MDDRLTEQAVRAAVRQQRRKDPWYKELLNFLIMLLVMGMALLATGVVAHVAWIVVREGWNLL